EIEADWHDADTAAEYQQYTDGGTAEYRIVVTNKGTGTLTDIPVVDSLYPSCDTVISSLVPEESATIFCSGVVNTGTTVNTASVTMTPPDGPQLSVSDPAGVVVPLPFQVTKVSAPASGANVAA